ncbi:MAG: hypothetical protein FWG67_01295 [Defluviitaleaceae bacterium]|nr:hypothetical protein [Defluviitaleaceae bacterium]
MTSNAVRIIQIDNQLPPLRTRRTNAESERNKVRTTIATLTNARNKLNAILNHYFHFSKNYAGLHEPVQTSHFKGSNRRNVESSLNQIGSHLKHEENHHHEHLETIKKRIAREENQEMTLTGQINSLNGQISSLENERRRLVLGY